MNFNIASKALASLLSQVSGFVGTDSVSLSIKKNRLVASAAKDGKSLSIVCSQLSVIDAEGSVTLDAGIMTKVLANRGDVSVSLSNSTLNVETTSGRKYSATVNCLPYEEVVHISPVAEGVKLDSGVLYEIIRLLPMCKISSVYVREDMFILISSRNGIFRIAVYDSFHAVYHEVEDSSHVADIEFTLPVSSLLDIISLADNKEFDLFVEENRVYAKARHFFVSVPKQVCSLPQYSFDSLDALRDTCVMEETTSRATIQTQELREVVANSLAIADNGVPISFSIAKGKLTANIKTSFGKVSAALTVEKSDLEWDKEVHSIEPYLLNDLLSVIGAKQISVYFKEHQICFINVAEGNTTSFYGCTLT